MNDRRYVLVVLGTGIAYAILLGLVATLCPKKAVDFDVIYHALKGQTPYALLSQEGIASSGANLNAPLMMWLLSPLRHLAFNHALLVLSCFSFVCLVITALWVLEEPALSIRQADKPWVLLLLLTSFPVLAAFIIGQVSAIVALFVIWGFRSYRQGLQVQAAACWSMATAFKLFPALLLLWMTRKRQWRVVSVAMGLLVAIHLFLWWQCPSYSLVSFFKTLGGVYWYGHSWNISAVSLPFTWLFSVHDTLAHYLYLKKLMILLFVLGLCAYCYVLPYLNSIEAQFAFTLISMGLLSPLFWIYFIPVLWFALIYMWQSSAEPLSRVCVLIALLWLLLPQVNYFAVRDSVTLLAAVARLSLPTCGLLLLAYPFLCFTQKPMVTEQAFAGWCDNKLLMGVMAILLTYSWLSAGMYLSAPQG